MRRSIMVLFALAVASEARAQSYLEDNADGAWRSRWLYANSDVESYYILNGGTDNPTNGYFWPVDRPAPNDPFNLDINFAPSFGNAIRNISITFYCYVDTTFYYTNSVGTVIYSSSCPASTTQTFSTTSATGIGGFGMGGGNHIEGNTQLKTITVTRDGDGDGSLVPADCNEGNGSIYPGAPELCDGVDNNCASGIDEGYANYDGDGMADCVDPNDDNDPDLDATDCNDFNNTIYTGATENTYGVDKDCDSNILCYLDSDADGFGVATFREETDKNGNCANKADLTSTLSNDCQDTGTDAKFTFVGAAPLTNASQCLQDVDGDDYGAKTPTGAGATAGNDCNDTVLAIRPGVAEIAGDGVDQNCDSAELCYTDADQDTFGTSTTVAESADAGFTCDTANKEADDTTDCQDTGTDAKFTFVGAAPNTSAVQCLQDVDGDDYGAKTPTGAGATAGNDCNDTVLAIRPGVAEIAGDGVDQNCDSAEICYTDADQDSFGTSTTVAESADVGITCDTANKEANDSLDCQDTGTDAKFTFVGAAPLTNASQCLQDVDGDDYGAKTPTGTGATVGNDCVDTVAAVRPGATEIAGDGVDQNCDAAELCFVDADQDSFGTSATVAESADADLICNVAGEAKNSTDCQDTGTDAKFTFVGAAPLTNASQCLQDVDGDDYGAKAPTGAGATVGNDCNDTVSAIRPGATEIAGDGLDQNCDAAELCYVDADQDSFGTSATVAESADADLICNVAGEAKNSTDCQDTGTDAKFTFVGAAPLTNASQCLQDVDGDDYGAKTPTGTGATVGNDCVDTVAAVRPGATEIAGDGVDQNCDSAELCYTDADQDTFGTSTTVAESSDADLICNVAGEAKNSTDCQDTGTDAKFTFVGAAPLTNASQCLQDVDGDDYGAKTPTGAGATVGNDCNDTALAIRPGATEIAGDGVDQNCDAAELCYVDADQDSFGTSATVAESADADLICNVAGEAKNSTDCQDTGTDAKFTFIGAAPLTNASQCLQDVDGDDYGAKTPTGAGATVGNDCNDTALAIRPGATEIAGDGIDQNCDAAELCYVDADQDSFGTSATVAESADVGITCDTANKEADDTTDCQDTGTDAKFTFVGAAPLTNASQCLQDVDGDDYGAKAPTGAGATVGNDCNDTALAIRPGATEIAGDGVDQNCDATELCYVDADQDSFGTSATVAETADVGLACDTANKEADDKTDCQDTGTDAKYTFVGAAPLTNAAQCLQDLDGDDYGALVPTGTGAVVGNDCNDVVASIRPGAAELTGDEVDQNCDLIEVCYLDSDDDGYRSTATVNSTTNLNCTDSKEGKAADPLDCSSGAVDNNATFNPGATELTGDEIDQNCDTKEVCFVDADDDGYRGTTTVSSLNLSCGDTKEGKASDPLDCASGADDSDKLINPGATEVCDNVDQDCDGTADDGLPTTTYYADADNDSFGSDNTGTIQDCDVAAPSGYEADNTDCNDNDAAINTLATEVPYDGVDDDCQGGDLVDVDGDGFDAKDVNGPDCNDNNAAVHPGVVETIDGVDQDCNGAVDDKTDAFDDDGDGFTEGAGDCDDADDLAFPNAPETCDDIDQDCDLVIDNGTECYDDDGDGYDELIGDCDDNDSDRNPDATENTTNGLDDDCDGKVDEGGTNDPDGDGVTVAGGDCEPNNGAVYPGAPEIVNNKDDNCDGEIDEGTTAYDDDLDGFSEDDGDCDDTDVDIAPDADEVANGIDDNCDGSVDEGTDAFDDDGDGTSEEGGDCDDTDPEISPAETEKNNGIDDNCDGEIDEGFGDEDGDGLTAADGDCDDTDPNIVPGTLESCDGVDNNCNAEIDEDCGGDTGVEEKKCGCTTGGGVFSLLPLGLLGLLVRRRRSR